MKYDFRLIARYIVLEYARSAPLPAGKIRRQHFESNRILEGMAGCYCYPDIQWFDGCFLADHQ